MRTSNQEMFPRTLTDGETNIGNGERVVSTVAGGGLIAYGLKQGGLAGTVLSLLGGGMLLRGATGHSRLYDAMGFDTFEGSRRRSPYGKSLLSGRVHVNRSVTINRSPAELYQFWRNFENLAQFMRHIENVTVQDGNRSHWKASAPMGFTVEWDAEITSDQANERIGWQSLEGSDIVNSGVVEFRPTTNRGTEVEVTLVYEAPGGKAGALLAKLFGEEPSQQVAEDLRRFKSLMETGMIITVKGQTSGRAEMPKAMAARTGGNR